MARPEDALQESIVTHIRKVAPKIFIFSIPNEGKRSLRLAVNLKRRGMVPGIPDLCLVEDGGRAFFLEVKAPKGRMQESQNDMTLAMLLRQIPRATVRSIADVETALKAWGLL